VTWLIALRHPAADAGVLVLAAAVALRVAAGARLVPGWAVLVAALALLLAAAPWVADRLVPPLRSRPVTTAGLVAALVVGTIAG
jgi:hypothetical protein